MKLSLLSLALGATVASSAPLLVSGHSRLPTEHRAGPFQSGHVQGIAIDRKGGFIYYSFTDTLAKYDFAGRLHGTLTGWSGHLGDLDFNEADGRIYGSLEYGKDQAFYVAVIDGSRIEKVGMAAQRSDVLRAVYLPEVTRDFAADAPDHRYGCSGIDGIAFGPAFGRGDGRRYLTVAYGIYGDTARTDNDHQVLLQYDAADWARTAQPLDETHLHSEGPAHPRAKVFVRTGNTRYGVQNLAYDETLQRWFMGVYQGAKPAFPNYTLFAVDARSQPRLAPLTGVPGPGGKGTAHGLLLPLSADGLTDPASGVRGWHQKADVGLQPLGGGLYYLTTNSGERGKQAAVNRLVRWTANHDHPFAPLD